MHVICFYVPTDSAETVKKALFDAGAGQIGNYSHCCFQYLGEGQFMPNEQANPSKGSINKLERLNEVKVEICCKPQFTKEAIQALKTAHPYEEVAYHVIESLPF